MYVLSTYPIPQVATYHEWMQDPVLQEQTASEPLTLDAEYEMQRSWRNDKDSVYGNMSRRLATI